MFSDSNPRVRWFCRDCGYPLDPTKAACANCDAAAKIPPVAPAHKADAGKAPWHLLPFDALAAIVKVLGFGAVKYPPRNWEKGMDWDRPYDSLMRHMTAWYLREGNDKETGFSHLCHAGCCILFLIAYEIRGVGKDTRPKINVD